MISFGPDRWNAPISLNLRDPPARPSLWELPTFPEFTEDCNSLRSDGAQRGIVVPSTTRSLELEAIEIECLYQSIRRRIATQSCIIAIWAFFHETLSTGVGQVVQWILVLVFVVIIVTLPRFARRLATRLGCPAPEDVVVELCRPVVGAMALDTTRDRIQEWKRLHGLER